MNKKIFFSVIVSSNKSFLWSSLYKSLFKNNKIPTEVIFVGPNRPSFKLFDFCYFKKTKVKPSQCWEIASRMAKGKYLLFAADDLRFSGNFLNNAYRHIESGKNIETIYAIKIFGNWGKGNTYEKLLRCGTLSVYIHSY